MKLTQTHWIVIGVVAIILIGLYINNAMKNAQPGQLPGRASIGYGPVNGWCCSGGEFIINANGTRTCPTGPWMRCGARPRL